MRIRSPDQSIKSSRYMELDVCVSVCRCFGERERKIGQKLKKEATFASCTFQQAFGTREECLSAQHMKQSVGQNKRDGKLNDPNSSRRETAIDFQRRRRRRLEDLVIVG